MDHVSATILANRLIGASVGGWKFEALINNGKSAAVFKGQKGRRRAAIKVFDSELIERYGDNTQLQRIERETALIGQEHPNLIRIYSGGYEDSLDIYYIIMSFVSGDNIKDALKSIPTSSIPTIMEQLSSAALFLENLGIVHRDIKPENIVINKKRDRITLLDLGVIRPIGVSSLTDPNGILAFVGTLQYSSPEFLLRKEANDLLGWRALTFYQLGGVLHDLIMHRALFEEFANPFARLVNAVQNETPAITSAEVPSYWVQLARKALIKDPGARLQMVDWEAFRASVAEARTGSARDRVAGKIALVRAGQSEAQDRSNEAHGRTGAQIRKSVIDQVKASARSIRNSIPQLPPITITGIPSEPDVLHLRFDGSQTLGVDAALSVKVKVDVIDNNSEAIRCSGCAIIAPASPQPDNECSHEWFSGILEAGLVNGAFEQFFFEIIEWYLGHNDVEDVPENTTKRWI